MKTIFEQRHFLGERHFLGKKPTFGMKNIFGVNKAFGTKHFFWARKFFESKVFLNKASLVTAISCLFLLSSLPCQAQEKKLDLKQRAGAYILSDIPLGDFSAYITAGFGAGIVYSIGLELFPGAEAGLLVRGEGNFSSLCKEPVTSFFSAKGRLGLYFSKGLGGGFFLAPELSWGGAFFFPKVDGSYENADKIKSLYIDQVIQAALGIRFAPRGFAKGALEFELSPAYSLFLEKDRLLHSVDVRAGALYRFN